MSAIDDILNSKLEWFEDAHGERFTYHGVTYQAIASQESLEPDYDTEGKRSRWRVVIDATLAQFNGDLPQVKDLLYYKGRTYSVREFDLDDHTIKMVCSTLGG